MNGSNAYKNYVNSFIDLAKHEMHIGMPCKVVSIKDYESKQTISVQPMTKFNSYFANGETAYPIINNVFVGVLNANNGKTLISLPIKKGDLGWVHFADHDLDNFAVSTSDEPVDTDLPTKFSLNSAMFVPYVRPITKALKGVSGNDLVIKHDRTTLTLFDNGKFSIQDSASPTSDEFVAVLSDLIKEIMSIKVITMMGSQPITVDAIAKLQAVKVRLDKLKK